MYSLTLKFVNDILSFVSTILDLVSSSLSDSIKLDNLDKTCVFSSLNLVSKTAIDNENTKIYRK